MQLGQILKRPSLLAIFPHVCTLVPSRASTTLWTVQDCTVVYIDIVLAGSNQRFKYATDIVSSFPSAENR